MFIKDKNHLKKMLILQMTSFLSLPSKTFAQSGSKNVVGTISPPPGVETWEQFNRGTALIAFISSLIKLGTVAAGVWVMINIILAGITYISSAGDSSATQKVMDKILYSVVGLAIIVLSYTIAGLVGLVFFGDASYILAPDIDVVLAP